MAVGPFELVFTLVFCGAIIYGHKGVFRRSEN